MLTVARSFRAVFLAAALLAPAACVYQPLYGANSYAPESAGSALSQIQVAEGQDWITQQVRNRLVFLLQGGRSTSEPVYELRMFVVNSDSLDATSRTVSDNTAGKTTVTAKYDLIRIGDGAIVAKGSRTATADFDRTGQSFANQRAVRDAQQRAAREVAEQLRLALAAQLSRS